ncbi:MAG: PilN domain-containing protein [Rhodocyclales bacterium]|nr:PilN domain-containing protein [Rhodocyclales bacterium]
MSAQINLYHSRYLRQRDPLTLNNVALVAGVCYLVLAAAAGWAWQGMARGRDAAAAAESQLKLVREQLAASAKAVAQRKSDPKVQGELERAEALLRSRAEIARLLEGGAIGSGAGFADFLRGFARQTPDGLWLTGFTIGNGGSDIEIRGSMLDPALLPDYIRRLGAEKAFQGRSFASLTMNRSEPPAASATAVRVTGVAPAPTLAARPIDFVLLPKLVAAREAGQ